MADKPYLVLTIQVFREEGYNVIAQIGGRELARAEGANLGDVLIALIRGVVRRL